MKISPPVIFILKKLYLLYCKWAASPLSVFTHALCTVGKTVNNINKTKGGPFGAHLRRSSTVVYFILQNTPSFICDER